MCLKFYGDINFLVFWWNVFRQQILQTLGHILTLFQDDMSLNVLIFVGARASFINWKGKTKKKLFIAFFLNTFYTVIRKKMMLKKTVNVNSTCTTVY